MSSLTELARQLKGIKENVILIYAFNATGKTRLSIEYKNITKNEDGAHSGVYYNAFSEDLFVWDNDSNNSEKNIKLDIKFSSLNRLHGSLTEEDVYKKLVPYKPKYNFFFTPNADPEKGFDSVTFYMEDNDDSPIKISRGEERIFVWCFFLALFDVEGWANVQNAHFFIDDPVSSLDDHNIFITAATLFELIENQFDKRKIIITSHHLGIISILSDWISKGEQKDKFKNKHRLYILEREGNGFELSSPKNSVLLYHLSLLQILDHAYKNDIYVYHFALLRQVLENIASFLGVGHFSYVLNQIGITDAARVADIVNALSHQKIYYYQSDVPVPDNVALFKDVYIGLQDKYKFVLHN